MTCSPCPTGVVAYSGSVAGSVDLVSLTHVQCIMDSPAAFEPLLTADGSLMFITSGSEVASAVVASVIPTMCRMVPALGFNNPPH